MGSDSLGALVGFIDLFALGFAVGNGAFSFLARVGALVGHLSDSCALGGSL